MTESSVPSVSRTEKRVTAGTLLSVMALAPPGASGDLAVAYDPARVVVLEDEA